MDFFYNLVEPPAPSQPPSPPVPTPSGTPTSKTFPLKPEDVPTGDPRGEAERMRREQKTPKPKYPDTPSIAPGVLPWTPTTTTKPWTPITPMPSVPRSEPTTARESYEQKLKEFDARPRVPTPYEMTSEETQTESIKRHQEWMRSAGIQEQKPLTAPVTCAPGQFFDGKQCRGSISTMPGGVPAGSQGGAIGPVSNLAPAGMPASSVMTGRVRFPVLNLRRI